MNRIVISKRALKEIDESCKWYDEQQDNLSDKFRFHLYAKLKLIILHPKRSVIKIQPYYEARLDVFPFQIIYKFDEQKKEIFIVSVFHFSRNPNKKYR
jgi:toxin ParE1/3/4